MTQTLTTDLDHYRDARQERRDQALICLFAAVLNTPLERRELTPEQQARRDARRHERSAHRQGLLARV